LAIEKNRLISCASGGRLNFRGRPEKLNTTETPQLSGRTAEMSFAATNAAKKATERMHRSAALKLKRTTPSALS
jgi:hypothetical protein